MDRVSPGNATQNTSSLLLQPSKTTVKLSSSRILPTHPASQTDTPLSGGATAHSAGYLHLTWEGGGLSGFAGCVPGF